MPFLRCVDLFYDMWKLIFVARNRGGIHREIIQLRRYSQTHHWCFAAGQRHKEMLVSRGICGCKHHGNSRNIAHVKERIPFGRFFSGISMIFDVMFGPKSMKWLWCFPLYFGTHDDRSGWEHHRTMMFGQEVTHRPVGKHIRKAA